MVEDLEKSYKRIEKRDRNLYELIRDAETQKTGNKITLDEARKIALDQIRKSGKITEEARKDWETYAFRYREYEEFEKGIQLLQKTLQEKYPDLQPVIRPSIAQLLQELIEENQNLKRVIEEDKREIQELKLEIKRLK